MEAYLGLGLKIINFNFFCVRGLFLLHSTFFWFSSLLSLFSSFSLSSIWPTQVPLSRISLLVHKSRPFSRYILLTRVLYFQFTYESFFSICDRQGLHLALRGRVVEAVEAAGFLLRWVPSQAIQLGGRIGPNSFIWIWNKEIFAKVWVSWFCFYKVHIFIWSGRSGGLR